MGEVYKLTESTVMYHLIRYHPSATLYSWYKGQKDIFSTSMGSITWLEKQTHIQSPYNKKQKISALTEAPRAKGEWGFGGAVGG